MYTIIRYIFLSELPRIPPLVRVHCTRHPGPQNPFCRIDSTNLENDVPRPWLNPLWCEIIIRLFAISFLLFFLLKIESSSGVCQCLESTSDQKALANCILTVCHRSLTACGVETRAFQLKHVQTRIDHITSNCAALSLSLSFSHFLETRQSRGARGWLFKK